MSAWADYAITALAYIGGTTLWMLCCVIAVVQISRSRRYVGRYLLVAISSLFFSLAFLWTGLLVFGAIHNSAIPQIRLILAVGTLTGWWAIILYLMRQWPWSSFGGSHDPKGDNYET